MPRHLPSKLLVANRGEIACRIMRTARRLGIATVAVYSDADASARHVREADERVRIGPAPVAESYLDVRRILAAATAHGATMLHPGYGFLAESADLAEASAAAGVTFVGPPPAAMRLLGDKAAAKALAMREGVPVVTGTVAASGDLALLTAEAAKLGFPLMVKAAAGGGGRGMRRVTRSDELAAALDGARREAEAAFGDGRLLLERAIDDPRHVEVQVFGDAHGNVVHLFERECSLQRRHQKVIEEAPAPGMSDGLRARLTDAAVRLARAAGYRGAGTVEFLVEGGTLAPGAPFYFIEANARLQVEHPVTEAITGLDLVEWQIRVAAGEPLPLAQPEIRRDGHAIEARICAEDPARDFAPGAGRIVTLHWPAADGLRVDLGFVAGDRVPPDYDSLIAKAIAHAADRDSARQRLAAWLDEAVVLGVPTNLAFLGALLRHPEVRQGRLGTGLIGRDCAALTRPPADLRAAVARGVGLLLDAERGASGPDGDGRSPWDATDGFQLGGVRRVRRTVLAGGETVEVETGGIAEGCWQVALDGVDRPTIPVATALTAVYDPETLRALVLDRGHQVEVRWARPAAGDGSGDGAAELRAPITGRVARLAVAAGDEISKGAVVAVVEAMKMEHMVVAPRAGRVARVLAGEGAQVAAGATLAELEPDPAREPEPGEPAP